MIAAATIRSYEDSNYVGITYLGALSHLNVILISRILAHPPILAQCKVHVPPMGPSSFARVW